MTGESRREAGARPGLVEMLAWGLAYIAADLLVRHLGLPASHILLWYPGAGLALAFLVRAGARGIPALVVARSLLSLWPTGPARPPWMVLVEATLVISIYAIAARALRSHLRGARPWSVGECAVCLLAMLGAPLLTALVGASSAAISFHLPSAVFLRQVLGFWLGDATGVLLLAPLLMLPWSRWRARPPVRSLAGPVALALIAMLLDFALERRGSSLGGYLWFLPLSWTAQRHGVRGAAIVNGVYAVALTASGPWFPLGDQAMFSAQILLLTLALAGLLIGATRSETAESDARYWHLLATANEGIWQLDAAGRTLYLNARMCEILGVTEDRVIGRDAGEFIAPEALPAWREGRARRVLGESAVYETSVVHSSGARRNVLVSASPVRSAVRGDTVGSVAMVTDVSDLRNAQAAHQAVDARRQRAEKLLETVFRTSPDAMVLFRAGDELIVDVNEAWCRTTGYSRDEVVGRSQKELGLWEDPADSDRLAAIIREHGSVAAFEFGFHRHGPGGAVEEGVAVLAARPAVVDGVTYLLCIGRDVTEERRQERERRQLQKLEDLGRLSGGIAHDFNNLLAVIRFYAEEARRRSVSGEPVAARDADEILSAVDRGIALTRRLLRFSKSAPVEPRRVRVDEVIGNAVGMLKPLLGATILDLDLAEHVPEVLADPTELEQVLLNLVINARDAMTDGGRIRVRTRSLSVPAGEVLNVVGFDVEPGTFAVLEVADEGSGMTEEVRSRIFEPFFTTKAGKGTGLGLAVVHGIVRQAHGGIRVDSAPGRGSVFRIFWPAAPLQTGAAGVGSPQQAEQFAPEALVLVVEDDPRVRSAIQRMLEAEGLSVETAGNGVEALAWLSDARDRGVRASLVITDVRMPLMDGPALARRLFQVDPRLPVLLITGDAQGDGGNAPSPACAVLPKPFTGAELTRAVRSRMAPQPVQSGAGGELT
ncbi:MAG TPA: PAS domain S-box protein [Myxococcales bacterium]|nr:PAS domain S-box protein [Myxococcales bacterium]